MKLNDPYAGILLKMERIKQNKGQKEICYGICVPSYLSKIERNQVQADESILEQLLGRLDIKYCFEKEFIESAEKMIEEYYENLFYGFDRNAVLDNLKKIDAELSFSPLAVDWLIIRGFEGEREVLPLLSELENVMTEYQRALYYILHSTDDQNSGRFLELYKKAYGILNNSYSLLVVMMDYYFYGEYDKVNEYADQCISLALEEGNTLSIAQCYEIQGNVYASLNVVPMMLQFYKRCINILRNTYWKEEIKNVYYNIGATYLCSGEYDLAMKYLDKSENACNKFLLYQKKVLVKIRGGHPDEAKKFLEMMKKYILNKSAVHEDNQVEKLMYEEVLMEMEDDFLSSPEFICKLENLMSVLKRDMHPGFILFYRNLLKEAYCKQRKYKKALELDDTISL